MEVTSTQAATAASQAASAAASTEQASAVLSSDFETFLQMLTAQARYQDPLEPIDSTEYAAQLAQFSMVEQQVLSNDLLAALGAQLDAGNIGQLASWIGLEARTTAPVAFDGAPITLLPQPDPTAEEAFLIVADADGVEVQRTRITTGSDSIEWDGTGNNGSVLPAGVYSFSVESLTAGNSLGVTTTQAYAPIVEASRLGNQTQLILQGGSAVSANEVSGLRQGT